MTVATIKLVDEQFMGQFYFRKDQAATARSLQNDGLYRTAGLMVVPLQGEAAAEELFDLTNNPSRQAERERVYGRARSISVGDIVEVDGRNWLCASQGWIDLS